MHADPKQYTTLADRLEYGPVVEGFKAELAQKLRSVRDNNLAQE